MQYSTDDGSDTLSDTAFSTSSIVSNSGSKNISVFAVQRTITLSFLSLWALMSSLIASMSCSFVPSNTLSALSDWLAAMKSGFNTAFNGLIFESLSSSLFTRSGSKTPALLHDSKRLADEISHPVMSKSVGHTVGKNSLIGLYTSLMPPFGSLWIPTLAVAHWVKLP